jgi:hypothetical protein
VLAILTSKLGLYGIAAALIAGAIFVQTARLAHAKADLARARASAASSESALKASEKSRASEYANARKEVSDAESACAARVAAAVKSGAAIRHIVEKPVAIDPKSHCPARSVIGAGELRDALQPRA